MRMRPPRRIDQPAVAPPRRPRPGRLRRDRARVAVGARRCRHAGLGRCARRGRVRRGPGVALLGASTGAALSAAGRRGPRRPRRRCRSGRAVREPGSDAAPRHDRDVRRPSVRRRTARRADGLALAPRICAGRPGVEPLLLNREPARFDGLYAALEPDTRDLVARLSPQSAISAIRVPVEIACAPFDPFCPSAESRALADAGHDVRLDRDVRPPARVSARPARLPHRRRARRPTPTCAAGAEPSSVLRPALAP